MDSEIVAQLIADSELVNGSVQVKIEYPRESKVVATIRRRITPVNLEITPDISQDQPTVTDTVFTSYQFNAQVLDIKAVTECLREKQIPCKGVRTHYRSDYGQNTDSNPPTYNFVFDDCSRESTCRSKKRRLDIN